MRKIWRDTDGRLIHIGEWDYKYQDRKTELIGASGRPVRKEVPTHLPPVGAYETERDIVEGFDGGLYEADDPRRLGPG